ncbi:hypothetical protein KMZ68_03820 [Bradyrhizobium sediminis]|uniref:Uncharacterized protein n=1 Tax=Bradyrhizobium sediminis TaxID=2840469 RepID=A0A975NQT5_9BRAD|nr:hypothetical protein [Bradyrhizobium sediminis]QWG19016.1 hypothetical protein KMZ68_03820 [Bradyrhizobium sediminis]
MLIGRPLLVKGAAIAEGLDLDALHRFCDRQGTDPIRRIFAEISPYAR